VRPSFNIAGCIPGERYMLPPERRLGRALRFIEEHPFFTLHAGRQTGQTTNLRWLEQHLDATGKHRAVWLDLETAGSGTPSRSSSAATPRPRPMRSSRWGATSTTSGCTTGGW
jgi:hypothetical protein